MNNQPVAWMVQYKGKHDFTFYKPISHDDAVVIPLYTYPAKDNYRETHEGFSTVIDAAHPAKTLTDEPLVNFKPIWQEKPELTLTDEEIKRTAVECGAYINEDTGSLYPDDMCVGSFARAILRKAQEK